jgi:hypothetical protein
MTNDDGTDHDRRFVEKREKFDRKSNAVDWSRIWIEGELTNAGYPMQLKDN